MDRRHDARRPVRLDELAALLGDAERLPEERLRRGRAEADDDGGRDQLDLPLEPGMARLDLHRARFRMDAPLAARDPFEMLHRVGDIGDRALDPSIDQRLVEELPGWSDEGRA